MAEKPNKKLAATAIAEPTVPAYRLHAAKSVLAERERELLDLKGHCSNSQCRLHYAHSGPCHVRGDGATHSRIMGYRTSDGRIHHPSDIEIIMETYLVAAVDAYAPEGES